MPAARGEHLLLTIEKRGMNTAFAAQRIATWAGVAEMAIGYAGMKDRHAVTRQRFSVHLPGRESPDLAMLVSEDLKVLDASRHSRKLNRGALRGNRFVLRLREVEGERAAIDERPAFDPQPRVSELFRRAALRPRGRKSRSRAADVRRHTGET